MFQKNSQNIAWQLQTLIATILSISLLVFCSIVVASNHALLRRSVAVTLSRRLQRACRLSMDCDMNLFESAMQSVFHNQLHLQCSRLEWMHHCEWRDGWQLAVTIDAISFDIALRWCVWVFAVCRTLHNWRSMKKKSILGVNALTNWHAARHTTPAPLIAKKNSIR